MSEPIKVKRKLDYLAKYANGHCLSRVIDAMLYDNIVTRAWKATRETLVKYCNGEKL